MKRICALMLSLCVALAAVPSLAEDAPVFTFEPEQLTLQAFVDTMYEEHTKYHAKHGEKAFAEYDLSDGTNVALEFPQGTPYTLFACLEYADNMVRTVAKSSNDVSKLFYYLFMVAQTTSLEPNAYFPMNIEKYESRYSRNVFLGVAQTGWWKTEQLTEGGDILQIIPAAMFDAKRNMVDEAIYMMCIYYTDAGTRVWFCADSYINYAMIAAVKPPNVKRDDEFTAWWDGQEDYRTAVAEDPESEAAWRLAYAEAINKGIYGE